MMPPSFASAKEFLDYIRGAYSDPMSQVQSEANVEFQKIHDEKLAQYGEQEEPAASESSYDNIAEGLWQLLREALSLEIFSGIEKVIAVGALDNISVNAFCSKSAEGYIVVVINAGLMALLNKLSKIDVAYSSPAAIIYCNRLKPEDITPELLLQWKLEVCEYYRDTGEPLGPQMHLSGQAELQHWSQLHLWEMYVFCHEMGHILSGHLDSAQYMSGEHSSEMVQTLEENKDHAMEHEADLLGYLLLRHYYHSAPMGAALEKDDDRGLLAVLIKFFDLFYLLGAEETSSHPHPLDRLCEVVAEVYGDAIARTLAGSYENHDLVAELFSEPLIAKQCLEKLQRKLEGSE